MKAATSHHVWEDCGRRTLPKGGRASECESCHEKRLSKGSLAVQVSAVAAAVDEDWADEVWKWAKNATSEGIQETVCEGTAKGNVVQKRPCGRCEKAMAATGDHGRG